MFENQPGGLKATSNVDNPHNGIMISHSEPTKYIATKLFTNISTNTLSNIDPKCQRWIIVVFNSGIDYHYEGIKEPQNCRR